MNESNLTLQAHVPLLRSVSVAPQILGTIQSIRFGGREVVLRWPRLVWTRDDQPILDAPDACSEDAVHELERISHFWWGDVGKRTGRNIEQTSVECVVLSLPVAKVEVSYSDYLYGLGHPVGPLVKEFAHFVDGWRDKFLRWVFLLTGQAVDPQVPPTSMLRVHYEGVSFWTENDGEMVGLCGLDGSVALSLPGDHNVHGVALTQQLLTDVLAAVDGDEREDTAMRLLRQGQAAIQRGEYRLALIELGSAAEVKLSIGPTEDSEQDKRTLGLLVDDTFGKDSADAERYRSGLVEPRNDAVHRADPLSHEIALVAYELVRDL
jgi:hypothetical protein